MWLLVDFDLGHPDHISIPTKQWSQIPSRLRREIRTIEKKGEGDLQGVYQQARRYVDFGKINLKNLRKLQKLDISGNDFARTSGLKTPKQSVKSNPKIALTDVQIHDQITHKSIPRSVLKYLPNNESIKYTEKAKTKKYLPIINSSNQTEKGLKEFSPRLKSNIFIEDIAASVEGNRLGDEKAVAIGKGVRKKLLSKVEKLATNTMEQPVIRDLLATKRQPTQDDVNEVIKAARERAKGIKQKLDERKLQNKEKPRSIQEKKNYLREKYDISNK